MVVELKYNSQFTLSSSSGATGRYSFAGNSVYDPDISSAGFQCPYYDIWTTVYRKYRVLGSRIKVTAMPAVTDGSAMRIDVCPVAGTGFAVTLDGYAGNARNKYGYAAGGMRPLTITSSATTGAVWGLTEAEMRGRDALTADYNANPTDEWAWVIAAQSASGSSLSIYANAEIWYQVEFFLRLPSDTDLSEVKRSRPSQSDKAKRLEKWEQHAAPYLKYVASQVPRKPESKSEFKSVEVAQVETKMETKARMGQQTAGETKESDDQLYALARKLFPGPPASVEVLKQKVAHELALAAAGGGAGKPA